MFMYSSNQGRVQLVRRVGETDLDGSIVAKFAANCKQAILSGGLHIVERLAENGALHEDPNMSYEASMLIANSFLPKQAFISTPDHEDLPLIIRPLWVQEDANLLHALDAIEPVDVITRDEAVDSLVSTISSLRLNNSTGTIIIVSSDWRLIRLLELCPDYRIEPDERWAQLGRLYDVPVCRSVHWTVGPNKIVIAQLSEWLSVYVHPDLRLRFQVVVRAVTPDDFERSLDSGNLRLPSEGKTREEFQMEFLAMNVVFEMREAVRVSVVNPKACTVIRYQGD